MSKRPGMKDISVSGTQQEAEFVSERAHKLGISGNEYMRRLISLGSVIECMREAPEGEHSPSLKIVAEYAGEIVSRYYISEMLL